MRLVPGTRIGPYEVVAKIGEGGMGEVYRATDTKLRRDAALKVLPESLTADPDRRARFTREAQVLASLNHPNIAGIYGFEDASGVPVLAMEFVEGEDLSTIISRGAIPLADVLPLARQIAEALEAAHEQGIVHRDLKPQNIKVKADGTVKVLDFGLARIVDASEAGGAGGTGGASGDNSPTITTPAMTLHGMILGTAAYMSPEQARGKPVDRRADIWAFGVVLYEMLTARRTFAGDEISDVLAAVLRQDVDWTALPAQTPASIRTLLRRCLEKDRKRRLDSAAAVRIEIDDAQAPMLETATPAVARGSGRLAWVVAVAAVIAALGLAARHFTEALPVVPLMTTSLTAPEGTALELAGIRNFATPELSPDGQWIVFGSASADNKAALWRRSLASGTAQMLANTDGATYPFWAPDSRSLAFFHEGKLKTISISGGPATILADAPNARGGSWGSEGIILFIPQTGPIFKIASTGGTPTPATSLAVTNSTYHSSPWFLPDGRHFLFGDSGPPGGVGMILRIGSRDSSETVEIGPVGSDAVYASGHLLFLRDQALVAQPFDPATRTVKGGAATVAEGVRTIQRNGRKGLFTVSGSGLLAYQTGDVGRQQHLTWFDRTGKTLGTLGEVAEFRSVQISPDGESTAVGIVDAGGNADLWIYDNARNLRTRFTSAPGQDRQLIWSPDGKSGIWNYVRGKQLLRKAADGSGSAEALYESQEPGDVGGYTPTSWSPDGKFLLINSFAPTRGVWMLPLVPEASGAPRKPVALIDTAFDDGWGVFSPDGRWVAFASDESQRMEVYITPFPGPGGKHRISVAGGRFPRWRRDGKEILFAGLDAVLMAANVTARPSGVDVGQVRSLGIVASSLGTNLAYDVSPDGRILAVIDAADTKAAPLTLVQNWPALLRK